MLVFSDRFHNEAHADSCQSSGHTSASAYAGYRILRGDSSLVPCDLYSPYMRALKKYFGIFEDIPRTVSVILVRWVVDLFGLDARKPTASINVKVLPRTPMSPERKALKAFFGARKVNGRNAP